MAVNRSGANVGYGLSNALQNLAPQPIISQRDPGVNDKAELGSLWINPTDQSCWAAVNAAAGQTNWLALGGGAAVFDSLTVNGDAEINGDAEVNGVITSFGLTTGGLETDTISVNGNSEFNGEVVLGGGNVGLIAVDTEVSVAGTTTRTVNANVGTVVITGLTTAANATQVVTITCDQIDANSAILSSVYNLDMSGNHAAMAVKGSVVSVVAGTLALTLVNNGVGALGAGDNVVITFWVMS